MNTPSIPMTLEAWNERHNCNLLFLRFEDLKANFDTVLQQLKEFLGISLTEAQTRDLKAATTLSSFKKNPFVNQEIEMKVYGNNKNSFMRKGTIGDWKSHFDMETNQDWDCWIREQLKGSDFKMVFE